ncbi:MAG: peptidase S8 [Bradyrhizobiaceae bacterium PARB1]|jgi:subtilase-type serine protease|nr:MAG: peptidase S8 [Bradyrhizobiaceae bacterium PARB1]
MLGQFFRGDRARTLLGGTALALLLAIGVMPAHAADAPTATNNSPNLPAQFPDPYLQTWNRDLIHAGAAYARGLTGAGVLVTVADTGFDTTNAALVNRLRLDLARSYVVVNGAAYNPYDVSPLPAGQVHGTHVAGIIAAQPFDNPGLVMHGIAYDAQIVPIRMLTDKFSSFAPGVDLPSASALTYFASLSGSMIYNASYGPNFKDFPRMQVWPIFPGTDLEGNAARLVLQAGKIIVAANANDRESQPDAAKNPTGLALLPYLSPQHANLGVYNDGGENYNYTDLQHQSGQIIAVMSVGDRKEAAAYSNLCGVTASWCVAAPGGNYSEPDTNRPPVYSSYDGNTYRFLQGTSMAAPAVSGALAILVQAFPDYNAQDLSHLLFSTTEDIGAAGIDRVYGHGLIRIDRAIAGPTSWVAGASVDVAAGRTSYWSMPLTTDGSLSKTGAGILTISGRTTALGDVDVDAGTLAVDGTLSLHANNLNINSTGTLAGFGTVIGNSIITGTLSPGKMANAEDLVNYGTIPAGTVPIGNSVGTLTFNGNVTLGSTATTRIDIDGTEILPGGPGTYDKIIVNGAGNVFWASGTLVPVLRGSIGTVSNYTPSLGTNFAIVQAYNGAETAGAFTSLLQPAEGMTPHTRLDTIYGHAAIWLAVTPESFASFATDAGLGNSSRQVAGILDAHRAAPGEMPSANDKALYDALYAQPDGARYERGIYDLTGAGQPAVMGAMAQTFQGFLGPIADRQNAYVLNGSAGMVGIAQAFAMAYDGRIMNATTTNAFASLDQPKPEQGWTVWGQGFGRLSTVNASGDLAGSRTTSTGFVMGADRIVSASLLAGGAFGFARTTASSDAATGTSDTYAGAAYATWTPGAAKLDLRVAAGPSQISTTRQTILSPGAISGGVNGFGTAVNLEAGYLIPVWQQAVLQPFAGLGWQGFRRGAYAENQQPFGLAYGAQFYDKLTTTLGVSMSAQLRTLDGTTLMPEVRLGWGHDLRDTTLVTQAALLDTPFTVAAAQPGRDAGLVGLKLSGWRSENVRLYGSYNGEFRSNAVSHQVAAGARFSW